ncbi:MAG: class I SAM-dependent methyltransferase, partial [Deferrisomatales bacterium]
DFNDETIRYTEARLRQAIRQAAPSAEVEMVHRSIHDLLKDASRRREAVAPQYDLVYCAGLFDYLGDRVCRQLVRLFWEWTVPGGLVLATNVHRSNPIRQFMEYLLEWYLVYRDEAGMESLAPPDAPRRVYTDPTGVNVFLELRKDGAQP